MNIQTEKLELMKLLLNTENPKVIQAIKRVFQKEKAADFWNELTVEQQQEIQEATAEINRGDTTNYESFMVKHRR
ncbi:hypothetical protein [Adhaeribacter soli]|uniref:Addiction module protein n=1 Tax=Adhaeribacter soli TaxID=2607655 RepID=A0A5N1IIH0_9BACT|nr:hypothetical protein [Adhaeribacter soli]KAA9324936.1 hypothetical protein F0P94_19385 [Adhaeribacter soli]